MADPWWLPGCLDNLRKIPGGVLCGDQHCQDVQTYYHAVCNCAPPYNNGCPPTNPPAGCCTYTATSPVIVLNTPNCYCCCGCFAHDTLVAFDRDQSKVIQEFIIGDPVYVATDPSLKSWVQKPVKFSSGTGNLGGYNTMIKVSYGDKEKPDFIIVNREQLFLMPNRKLKRASRLVPGQDHLLLQKGTQVTVLDLTVGKFQKGVHQLSTSTQPTTNMGGHLMLANGVVCGDYALQVTNLDVVSPKLMVDGHAQLPEFGTKEYGVKYSHLIADGFRAYASGYKIEHGEPSLFRPFGVEGPVRIPKDAEYFVTKQQAEDLKEYAPHSPSHSGAGKDIANYLFKLFKGFYPSVIFYLDEENDLPNAYSWIEYDIPFVVVTGGLIRTYAIRFESLAFVIAHELGHLYGGSPQDDRGYTCAGMADYAAILAVFPYIWFGIYAGPMIHPAIEQVTELFNYIQPTHRKGKPGNKCMYISIDCRLKSMNAAANTYSLPECAGGPLDPTLEVVGASASKHPDGTYVTVAFNENVDPKSGAEIGNYAFFPLAEAFAASVDSSDQSKVDIRVDVDAGVQYRVSAIGVLSETSHPLVPGKTSANFELP